MKLGDMNEKQLWVLIGGTIIIIAFLFYWLGTTVELQPVITFANKTYDAACVAKCMIP